MRDKGGLRMFAVRATRTRHGFLQAAAVVFVLFLGFFWTAGAEGVPADEAERLTLESAVQRGLTHATSLVLAQFSIEEAEIALEEALMVRLAGQPGSTVQQAVAELADARARYIETLVQGALQLWEADDD